MKVLIVSGTREELSPVEIKLVESEWFRWRPDIVIHGDCPTGVDRLAFDYHCDMPGCCLMPMPAQWEKHGKRAGPLRNGHMIRIGSLLQQYGYTVDYLAFPKGESRGTRDFIRQAQACGLNGKVVEL